MSFASFSYLLHKKDPHSQGTADPIQYGNEPSNSIAILELIALSLNSVNIFDLIFFCLYNPLRIIRQ